MKLQENIYHKFSTNIPMIAIGIIKRIQGRTSAIIQITNKLNNIATIIQITLRIVYCKNINLFITV